MVLWDWEYDDDFVQALLTGAHRRRLSARAFRPSEFSHFAHLCQGRRFSFPYLIDRATDVHASLLPALSQLQKGGTLLINDPEQMIRCRDKATMHLELVQQGIPVPYGIILSHQDHPEQAAQQAWQKLGTPFVIKPAEGGGGEGVILEATTPEQIRQALHESKSGKIILQKKIQPGEIAGHRAWLRVFYVMDQVIPCWWDDRSHLYSLIADPTASWLSPIHEIVHHIARLSAMHFFSTEITLTNEHELYVIDFVNEMCDMRRQSHHPDGVPDVLFAKIVDLLLSHHPSQAN